MQGLFTHKRTYDRQGSVLDRLVRKKKKAAPLVTGYTQWLSVRLLPSLIVLCTAIDTGSGMVPSVFDALDRGDKFVVSNSLFA